MIMCNNTVTRFIHRTQDYGLVFRHQYEVQPGYGKSADIISVTGWFKDVKPRRSADRKPKALARTTI